MGDAEIEEVALGKAENMVIDGQLLPETKVEPAAPPPLPRLVPMAAEEDD